MRVNLNLNYNKNNTNLYAAFQKSYQSTKPMSFDSFTFKGNFEDEPDQEDYEFMEIPTDKEIEKNKAKKEAALRKQALQEATKDEKEAYHEGYTNGMRDSGRLGWLALVLNVLMYVSILDTVFGIRRDTSDIDYDIGSLRKEIISKQNKMFGNMKDMQEDVDSIQEQMDEIIELIGQKYDLEEQIKALPSDDEKAQELKQKLKDLEDELQEYMLEN